MDAQALLLSMLGAVLVSVVASVAALMIKAATARQVASGTAKDAKAAALSIFPKARVDNDYSEVRGPDGWTYLLLTSEKNPTLALARLVEMNRRMKLLLAEVSKQWGAGDERVKRMAKMWAGPMSPVNQADLARWWDPGAGALGGWAGSSWWVWFGSPTDQTDNDNLDSLLHEVAHCLCQNNCTCTPGPPCTCLYEGKCAAWMYSGHGPGWNEIQRDLRVIAHRMGLRAFNASWNCREQCGNLGG